MVKEIRYSAKSSSSGATVAVMSRKGYWLTERPAATGGELFAISTRALKTATVTNLHMESQDAPKKRSLFKRWWFWAIVGIIIVLIVSGSSSSGDSSQSAPVASAQTSGACATSLSTLKGEVQPVTYKELEKDSDSYNGQVVTFTGQVLEIEQNGDNGVMRLSVTDLGDDIWSPTDVVYVTYDGTTTPVQDDIVTVTGTLTGSYTYTSEANYQITLPSMDTCGSDIREASSAKSVANVSVAPASTVSASEPTAPVESASVPVTPPVPASTATWHTAYTYSGNALTQTPAFSMQGSQWKVTYSCTPDADASSSGVQPYFQGWVADTNTNSEASLFANDVDCPSSQTSYAYSQPPGQYYLNVGSMDANYSVTVEDYY
jgi:hypothetical protein